MSAAEVAAELAALTLEPAVHRLPSEIIAAIARIIAAWDAADARHMRNKGRGCKELAAMLAVCHAWRNPLLTSEPAWMRLLEARFPQLSLSMSFDCQSKSFHRKGRLSCRNHFLVQQAVERLRDAAVAPPPLCTDERVGLEDFTFSVETRVTGWRGSWMSVHDDKAPAQVKRPWAHCSHCPGQPQAM